MEWARQRPWRDVFAWVIFMRQHKEHHNIIQLPRRQTLSSLLIRKLGQQPPFWLDKIIYNAVSLMLEMGMTVQPLGRQSLEWKDIWSSQNASNIKYLQRRSAQDSVYDIWCEIKIHLLLNLGNPRTALKIIAPKKTDATGELIKSSLKVSNGCLN